MEEMILEFENVSGTSRKFRLDNINFALPAGYIMGLMGNNGAGKTTLLNYILDEKKRYTGTIRVGGEDIRKNPACIRNKIGFVSEDNHFFDERTADQNVQMLKMFYEEFDMEIYNEALKIMGLSGGKTYRKMSRGEKLKFQLAFAMAHKPVLYLLDEATVGMDPVFRVDFFKILGKIIEGEEASVLMTSHIESEMEQKTDYVGILENGKLVQFGESIDVIPQRREMIVSGGQGE